MSSSRKHVRHLEVSSSECKLLVNLLLAAQQGVLSDVEASLVGSLMRKLNGENT